MGTALPAGTAGSNLGRLAALAAGLVPVTCVGESEAEREAGQTFSILDKQLKDGLKGFFANEIRPLVIAYEPVWAIGTGKTATPDQAQEVHAHIRAFVARQDPGVAARMPILYGGSVKAASARSLFAMPDVDGGLIGGASLVPGDFIAVVQAAARAAKLNG